jgi:hypothetical protein
MSQHGLPAVDASPACTHRPPDALITSMPSRTHLARASASGALALAAAQMVDMQVTGRPGSDTPVRAVEILRHRPVRDAAARTAVGYSVQSLLAPVAAVAGQLAGPRVTRRFAAATLAPLVVVGIVNPAFGVSPWPWRWTRDDWTRELTLKSVLAIATIAAL